MLYVVAAPDRLARQGQQAEAQLRGALHLGDRAFEIAGGDGRGRRHAVAVSAERLVGPVVEDAALGHREDRIGRGPHGQALVGKDHLDVDAVLGHVAKAFARIGADDLAQAVLAVEGVSA
jgi:hypothetical protein